ncbi:transposase [filamentous cyanobacterium CCP5]|nr:transposase [filamentous cyanobacterium CCP5]
MKYHPERHHRRSIRLKGFNYASEAFYFVTLCSYQRQCLFGTIIDGEVQLNEFGEIVAAEWMRTSDIRPNISLDEWVVMPNHIHGIISIRQTVSTPDATLSEAAQGCTSLQGGIAYRRPKLLSSLVSGFKLATTKQINIRRNAAGTPVWQRNYYERIMRDENALVRVQRYIQNNPSKWQEDRLRPAIMNS